MNDLEAIRDGEAYLEGDRFTDSVDVVRNLCDAVKQLRAENEALRAQQRWVPVEEALPEQYEKVLVINGRGVMFIDFCDSTGKFNHDETLRVARRSREQVDRFVVAWQPLPLAPDAPQSGFVINAKLMRPTGQIESRMQPPVPPLDAPQAQGITPDDLAQLHTEIEKLGKLPGKAEVISEPGAAIEVRVVPMPPHVQRGIQRGLELGTDASRRDAPQAQEAS